MHPALSFLSFLLIISLSLPSGQSERLELQCKFRSIKNYSCLGSVLDAFTRDFVISKIDGVHEDKKSNDHVNALVVKGQTISFLPANVADFFPRLSRYEVTNSSLQEVKRSDFKGLSQLDTLVLDFNVIKVLPSDVFDDLSQLQNLRLSGNEINQIDYKTFLKPLKLEVLLLGNNKLNYIHENLFMALADLKEIYLQNNQIQELREGTFSRNRKLELIDLRHNKLNSVAPKLLNELDVIKSYHFSDNVCITETYTTVEQLKEMFHNRCFPPYLKGYDDQIDSLKIALNSLNETLARSEKKLEETKTEFVTCESNLATLKSEKNSSDIEKAECLSSRGKAEIDLKSCISREQDKEKELTVATEKLTEYIETEKGSLQRSEFINKTTTEMMNEKRQCKLDLALITNLLKDKEDSESERNNELQSKINDLISDKASLTLQLETHDKELSTLRNVIEEFNLTRTQMNEENLNLSQALANKTNAECLPAELIKCRQDYEKIFYELTELSLSCSKKDDDLKSCMNQMPLCNNFLIDCTFQMRNSDYICVAKHVMACQPGMRLSKVSGTHEFDKTNLDVQTLEIRDSLFHFSKDIFESLPSLRRIKIIESGLSTLNPKLKSTRLTQVEIEGNNFIDVPGEIFSDVPQLEVLHLDSNQIVELHQDSFKSLSELLELRLEDNKISRLPRGVFDHLLNLKSLSLRKNMLTSLDDFVLSGMSSLAVIRFDENRSLQLIDSTLLDNLKALQTTDFRKTCVGNDYYDVETTKTRIMSNCLKKVT